MYYCTSTINLKMKAKKTEKRKKIANFGHRIKLLRVERGLTQAQLAEFANVSIDYIRAIEGSKRSNPSFAIAIRILVALEQNIGDLNGWV